MAAVTVPRSYAILDGLALTQRDDELGVEYVLFDIEDGWGSPASTKKRAARARRHGTWSGKGFLEPRSFLLTGSVAVRNADDLQAAEDRLIAAASLDDVILEVVEGPLSRYCIVSRSGDVGIKRITDYESTWDIRLTADDPRRFASALTDSTALPSSSGGLTLPFTIPFAINATQVSGQVSLVNPGNIAGPVKHRIDGPVIGPVVTHVGSGRSLVFASSLVLGAGEFVTVDMERHEVLAQGTAPRNQWVTERGWSAFEPGPNTWAFTALAYDAGARLTVEATPAYQ